MTVTLDLTPEVRARALAQAEAAGLPLERYLQSIIEQGTLPANSGPVTLEEQERLLDELARRHANLPASSVDSFSRESIYRDHD
jgi:hypothetical protein